GTSSDSLKRLESVRAFLLYAKKEGFTRTNLSINLKVKRSSAKAQGPLKRPAQEKSVPLTAEGRARLLQELESLKQQRVSIVEELRRAAADKDFRENAPLEAARQYQGQTEARIRELEEALRSGTIQPDAGPEGEKVGVGKVVALLDLISGERLHYTLVSPREANPMEGRISVESPVGKALLAKRRGEEVEVSAPAGTLRYRIEEIEG
ncbi:MAG: transcription elongation factor GreA, partial [Dehalococcoidia bacterium]